MIPPAVRQATSKSKLSIDWRPSGVYAELPMEITKIVEELRGNDPRPLLILRDCNGCANKEGDRLRRALEDEHFALATEWFHCVKLGPEALEEGHWAHALYDDKVPTHVTVASWDGTVVRNIKKATPTELWRGMRKVVRHDYKKNPDTPLKKLQKMLGAFDLLDEREDELKRQIAGTDPKFQKARLKKLERELTEVGVEREELFAKERELRELTLKRLEEEAKAEADKKG